MKNPRVWLQMLSLLVVLGGAGSASASDLILGVDTSAGVTVGAPTWNEGTSTAWGVRVGVGLPVPGVRLIPEGSLSLMSLSPEDATLPVMELQSLRLGGRAGLESPLSPFVYGHMGWTWSGGALAVMGSRGEVLSSWDAGVGLDLTALPTLNVGVTAGAQWIQITEGDEPLRQLEVGVHLEIVF